MFGVKTYFWIHWIRIMTPVITWFGIDLRCIPAKFGWYNCKAVTLVLWSTIRIRNWSGAGSRSRIRLHFWSHLGMGHTCVNFGWNRCRGCKVWKSRIRILGSRPIKWCKRRVLTLFPISPSTHSVAFDVKPYFWIHWIQIRMRIMTPTTMWVGVDLRYVRTCQVSLLYLQSSSSSAVKCNCWQEEEEEWTTQPSISSTLPFYLFFKKLKMERRAKKILWFLFYLELNKPNQICPK